MVDHNGYPFTVKQMVELDACVRCELCREACSMYQLLSENPHPLGFPTSSSAMIRQFRTIIRSQFGLKAKFLGRKPAIGEGLWRLADALFLHCTTCGRCRVSCPLGIDTWSLVNSMREYFMNGYTSQYPEHCAVELVDTVHGTIQRSGNIFALPNSSRRDWADYTGAEVKLKEKAKVVYFTGCVSSFQGRAQDIARAITAILNHVGEDWTLLQDEWCCGHPLAVSGAANRAKTTAEHNIKAIEEVGAKLVVTGCPGCYLALKQECPKILGRSPNFQALHSTQLLDTYVREGRLEIPKFDEDATYHDPCELARLGGVVGEPRRILKAITRELREPRGPGMDGICCGQGGLLKATNPSLAESLTAKRLEMLAETRANLILSACPTCVQGFGRIATDQNNGLRVMDVSELVARQLGLM